MNKRITAGLLAAATAGAVGVSTAAPASATNGNLCGSYPPRGIGYGLTNSPHNATINRGAIIRLRAHLVRERANCSAAHIAVFTRTARQTRYAQSNRGITNAVGETSVPVKYLRTVRYFFEYDFDAHTIGARSYGSAIFVR